MTVSPNQIIIIIIIIPGKIDLASITYSDITKITIYDRLHVIEDKKSHHHHHFNVHVLPRFQD